MNSSRATCDQKRLPLTTVYLRDFARSIALLTQGCPLHWAYALCSLAAFGGSLMVRSSSSSPHISKPWWLAMAAAWAIATPATAQEGRQPDVVAATHPWVPGASSPAVGPAPEQRQSLRAETPADMVVHEVPAQEGEPVAESDQVPLPLPSTEPGESEAIAEVAEPPTPSPASVLKVEDPVPVPAPEAEGPAADTVDPASVETSPTPTAESLPADPVSSEETDGPELTQRSWPESNS